MDKETDATPVAPAAVLQRRRPRTDYQRVAIESFQAKLPAGSPLHEVLARSAVKQAIVTYEARNARAMRLQGRFRRLGWFALLLSTIGTLAAAATLIPISRWLPDGAPRIVSGLQSLANLIAFGIVIWLSRSCLADAWMRTRAEAEVARGSIFSAILAEKSFVRSDIARLLRDQLDLIETAYLDDQMAYFKRASMRHQKEATKLQAPRLVSILTTLAASAVGLLTLWGGKLGPLDGPVHWLLIDQEPIRWQLGLNTIGASLLAYASARTAMLQDERNAALYASTFRKLEALKAEKLADVRAAADNGDVVNVRQFLREIEGILEADHQAWLLARPPSDPTAGPVRKV